MKLWQYVTQVTGAEWPKAYQPKSPCPTLKFIDAVTSVLGVIEERARMEASRQGAGAKIVADHTLPREERRAHLEQMLLALDKTPEDPKQLEADLLLTSGMTPEVEKRHEEPDAISRLFAQSSANDAVVAEVDDPFLEDEAEEEREPPKMIPGHEMLGDTPVVFQPQNVMTMARVGQPLSEVASQADVFIRYKCRKGECKTCAVNIDGKWVSACQTKIPHRAPNQPFEVRVRQLSTTKQTEEEKAAFFSPQSVYDGFFNNAIGMLGFAKEGMAADPDFVHRMEKEKLIEELTAKAKGRKTAGKASLRGSSASPGKVSHEAPVVEQGGSSAKFLLPGLAAATAGLMRPFRKR